MLSPTGGDVPKQSTHATNGSQPKQSQQPTAPVTAAERNAREHTSQFQQSDTTATYLMRIGSNRHQPAYRQFPTTRSGFQRNDPTEDLHSLPAREASLKDVKYAVGHEKFPSWPTSASAEAGSRPHAAPGTSLRSKSWTDRMCYPKEPIVAYARPFMKRMAHAQPQQLKPVSEGPDKAAGGLDKRVCAASDPSCPSSDMKERGYTAFPPEFTQYHRSTSQPNEQKKLTQAELEEYTRNYEETLTVQHQKQSSYAQSEGYHSYVSSTDSTSTPFLDRLRREADGAISRMNSAWESRDRDSVVTASSETASTSETLKWHGSLSDISVASSSFSSTSKQHQLIVHSSKVKTPQRHSSESVLYIDNGRVEEIEHRAPPSCQQHLKWFPISTYAVHDTENRFKSNSFMPLQKSVAERVNELERQNLKSRQENNRQPFDLSLKTKQKKSGLSFYERQQRQEDAKQIWRSEPHLISGQLQVASPTKPQPSSRRASTASEYVDWKDHINQDTKIETTDIKNVNDTKTKHISTYIPDNSRLSPNSILDGPVIVGPVISVDDWVPERPPKNPQLLRNAFPDLFRQEERLPSPDLPLPSPPTVLEDEFFNSDEPFPPLPAEIVNDFNQGHDDPNKLYNESKSIRSSNLTSTDSIIKPTPIRSTAVTHEAHFDKNSSKRIANKESNQSPQRPADTISLTTANILPKSQNNYSRQSCNFRNDRLCRSSFRVSQETPVFSTNVDVRASMRHYRNNPMFVDKLPLPQKQVGSAQKILSRSTTVDETSPKRPMNSYSRSTSMFPNKSEATVVQTYQVLNEKRDSGMSYRQPILSTKQCLRASQSNETNDGADSKSCECDKNNKLASKTIPIYNYTETRVDVKSNVASNTLNALSKNHGSQEIRNNIIMKPLKTAAGPAPPLYPKQQSIKKPHDLSVAPSLLPCNRSQETSSYTPSRATLPDSGAGSYKLIQKDGAVTYSAQRVDITDSFSDLVKDRATLQLLSSTDTKPENETLTAATEDTNMEKIDIPKSSESLKTIITEIKQPENIDETLVQVIEKPSSAPSNQTNNVIEKIENSTCELPVNISEQESKQIPQITINWAEEQAESCWSKLHVEVEWQKIRRRLLTAVTPDHRLLNHALINKDLTNPSDFISDYFSSNSTSSTSHTANKSEEGEGAAESAGSAARRRHGGARGDDAPSAGATPTLIDLKRDALCCCENLVEALKTEMESTVGATAENETLGASVQSMLDSKLAARFALHNTEVYHISALMAGLSARLARTHDEIAAECDLQTLNELNSKRAKLEEQMAEARTLKTNIDQRGGSLDAALAASLENPERLRDARVFILNKARLNIRSRHLSHRLDYARDTLRLLRHTENDDR